ncbi:hypothetical protein EVAR_89718_1 [Eumeta japonica]|uniref:Uncharacterized protein n=1 Tax=Eumeta variegata TaxID=151549 RepID=A0A4C1Y653_EUMVA|nr:hypothetical protein EVAR_89718_1 [Eumeta japonica]
MTRDSRTITMEPETVDEYREQDGPRPRFRRRVHAVEKLIENGYAFRIGSVAFTGTSGHVSASTCLRSRSTSAAISVQRADRDSEPRVRDDFADFWRVVIADVLIYVLNKMRKHVQIGTQMLKWQ